MTKNYFSISELTYSDTAKRKGIVNSPSKTETDALHCLITECLNPIREAYGKPITVSSGYRCAGLNRAVGGVSNSQHTKGEAADLVGSDNNETRKIYETARVLGVYDQLLFEKNSKGSIWVHISHKKTGDRKQAIDNYEVK